MRVKFVMVPQIRRGMSSKNEGPNPMSPKNNETPPMVKATG